MREHIRALLEGAGLAAAATGFGMIYPPLGLVAAGVALIWVSYGLGGGT